MDQPSLVWQPESVLGRIFLWAVPLLALSMLVLFLIPSQVWHRPSDFSVYRGFDPNLIYVRSGSDTHPGGILRISSESMTLTATPGTQPVAYLLTTKMSYSASMDVRILANTSGIPLQLGIWSPRKDTSYYVKFGPPPGNLVTAETATRTKVVKAQALGNYEVGQTYHLEISYDGQKGLIESRVSGSERPPTGSNMLFLVGGPSSPAYREVHSQPVRVNGGKDYVFGGNIKLAFGKGNYKLALVWLDPEKRWIGHALDWHSATELHGWTAKNFRAQAPPNAIFAMLTLAADDATHYLMSDMFVRRSGGPGGNLLAHGDFARGREGWNQIAPPDPTPLPNEQPTIIRPSRRSVEASVTAKEAPELFLYLPASLTVMSSSSRGLNEALLTDYTLRLPSQDWFAVRVDDTRLAKLLLVLTIAGSVLCIARMGLWVNEAIVRRVSYWRTSHPTTWSDKPVTVQAGLLATVGGAVLAYLVLNALLFNLGYHPQDFISEKLFSYVAFRYGPAQVYFLPALTSPADQWGGVPYAEALFPYQPVMAYFFTLIGWTYRLFLADPGILRVDTFQLGFVIKSFNVLFAVASAWLIYLILRHLKVNQRLRLLICSLFLFNPAVWFLASVFGQTHTVPIFLLLAAICLTIRNRPQGAWVALGLTALTRIQILPPAFLLALVLLRRFPIKQNLYAISWAIIIVFIVLTPFSMALSPSLPLDAQRQLMRELNPEKEIGEYYSISISANNIWPLVSGFRDGLKGAERFHVPATARLAGPFTYFDVGNILFVSTFIILAAALLFSRHLVRTDTDFLPAIAAGQLAVLMLRTGVASTHFVLTLALVALSRVSFSGFGYYASFTILTLTTFFGSYADLGGALWQVGYLAPALHASNNPVTKFAMDLYFGDWSITIGALANIAVFLWWATKAVRPTSQ